MSRNNHQDFSDTSSNLIDKRYPFQALPISFNLCLILFKLFRVHT